MEITIAGAVRTVHFGAWIFNPSMRLSASSEVNRILRTRGATSRVGNWSELLSTVAGLGCEVAVLLTDFDPIVTNDLHRSCWSAYRILRADAFKRARGRMQIICSTHDARNEAFASYIQQPPLRRLVDRLNSEGRARAGRRFADMPGVWPFISFDRRVGTFSIVDPPPYYSLRPASHHQKICVIDSKIGFCGGLDVNYGRLDTKQHKKLWHDVHCRVDAHLAFDIDRNFAGRWNRELTAFNEFIRSPTIRGRLAADVVTAITVPDSVPPPGTGSAVGQLVRTLSSNALLDPVPNNLRADIRNAYQRAIGLAHEFIYIENQYLRDKRLADWLVDRANEVPELVVLIVLPVAPEEIAGRSGADAVTLKGLFLQQNILLRLQSELGTRLGIYSMVEQQATIRPHATNWANSRQIYVHSKLAIIDDNWATIGSANTNLRSFEVDTEANIHWYDRTSVRRLRLELWRELLGSPQTIEGWRPSEFIPRWNERALANLHVTPRERRGFVVPHDPNNPRVTGAQSLFIPDAFTELVELDADNDYLI